MSEEEVELKVRTEPLSNCDIVLLTDDWATVVISMELSEMIDNDLEGCLDLMSERVIGSVLLTNITYEVVGHLGDTLYVKVSGETSEVEPEPEEWSVQECRRYLHHHKVEYAIPEDHVLEAWRELVIVHMEKTNAD